MDLSMSAISSCLSSPCSTCRSMSSAFTRPCCASDIISTFRASSKAAYCSSKRFLYFVASDWKWLKSGSALRGRYRGRTHLCAVFSISIMASNIFR